MLLACFGSERFTLFELRNALILLQHMVLRKIGGIWVIRHRGRCKHPYPEARREEILHASSRTQQSPRPHPHGSRVSRTTVSGWIKKSSSASAFVDHSAYSGTRRSHIHHPGTLSTLVVCAQKSTRLLDVDCPLPKEPTGGGLCDWGSEPARRVSGCGKPFQRGIARGIASPISGRPTRQ